MAVKVRGVPSPRLQCVMCSKPMPYWSSHVRADGLSGRIIGRTFERYKGYPFRDPLFCTLRCALSFAIAAHTAGYRRQE